VGRGRHLREYLKKPSEEESEDDHHEEWLDDRPEKTKGGLVVPNFHVTGDKTVKQFAVFSRARGNLPAPIFLGGG